VRGGAGFYSGVTLEGVENYTAFAKSPVTGWSGHVAVERSAIDNPRSWANAGVAAAVLAALALAAGLLFYAAYETRRRRVEEHRLLGMQKAEAISRFTGMMAHDFRNILAVIDAGVRLITRHTGEPDTAKKAEAIGTAVEKGKRLINQLLSFVRGDGAAVEQVDLKRCLDEFAELLARSLGDSIALHWSVAEDARDVCVNPDQLELALLNLAINARDAMDGTGEFSIHATRHEDLAEIAVCDSGPGVPAALRERIFDAFYSTKGDGKGTGLGLAQVAGAVRQAGGRVEIRDNPAGGACFAIYLPLANLPAV
jgi:signal transduction histidine kinase